MAEDPVCLAVPPCPTPRSVAPRFWMIIRFIFTSARGDTDPGVRFGREFVFFYFHASAPLPRRRAILSRAPAQFSIFFHLLTRLHERCRLTWRECVFSLFLQQLPDKLPSLTNNSPRKPTSRGQEEHSSSSSGSFHCIHLLSLQRSVDVLSSEGEEATPTKTKGKKHKNEKQEKRQKKERKQEKERNAEDKESNADVAPEGFLTQSEFAWTNHFKNKVIHDSLRSTTKELRDRSTHRSGSFICPKTKFAEFINFFL